MSNSVVSFKKGAKRENVGGERESDFSLGLRAI